MMAEALAMANGDPTMIGYLLRRQLRPRLPAVRARVQRQLPRPARAAERAAVGRLRRPGGGRPRDPHAGHGTYLAVVNTGFNAKGRSLIRLPAPGKVTEAVSGKSLEAREGVVELALHPFELRSLRIEN